MSIITYGLGVHWCLESLKTLPQKYHHKIEIIDLKSLVPWDQELVLKSIQKTNRAMIIHEATHTSGFGAEIAATLSQEAFEYLDAPILRLASLDTPTPFSSNIELNIFWPKNKINKKIKELLEY